MTATSGTGRYNARASALRDRRDEALERGDASAVAEIDDEFGRALVALENDRAEERFERFWPGSGRTW